MKQYKINNAYPILVKIMNFDLPIYKAKEIYLLIKAIEKHYKFALEREKKNIEDCSGIIQDDGSIKFETPEKTQLFREKSEELYNMEVSIDISPIHLSYDDVKEQKLKPIDIFNLEDFIVFD